MVNISAKLIENTMASGAISKQHPLRTGQILNGKVLELYPGQRAAIQLGGKQIIAQLETSLSSKQSYLFQVTAVGQLTQLKKITETPTQHRNMISDQLLQQLGVANQKELKALLTELIQRQIPFTAKNVHVLAQLFDQFGANQTNRNVLHTMMQQNLPLTEQVFSSVRTFQSTSLGEQINPLLQLLAVKGNTQNTQVIQDLQQQLRAFTADIAGGQSLARILTKNAAMVDQLLSKVAATSGGQAQTPSLFDSSEIITQIANGKTPPAAAVQSFVTGLQRLMNQQVMIKPNDHQLIQAFLQRLSQNSTIQGSSGHIKTIVEQQPVLQKMIQQAPNQAQQVVQSWLQDPMPSISLKQQVRSVYQHVYDQQLTQPEQNLARSLLLQLTNADQSALSVKDQFFHLLKQFILTSGLQDEAMLAQELTSSQNQQFSRDSDLSIKQNLQIANQQGDLTTGAERIQRLLQTLTGMQLNMIQQDPSILQQSFQIPGERFGLAEDIRLQFEGKKKQNSDEIDPDYCRILFHLDLHTLGETLITMSIQKRVINLTVYTDREMVKPLLEGMKPALKQKLADLDYQLSSVSQKSLTEEHIQEKSVRHAITNTAQPVSEGIDFRI
ncbi:hypothetical protein [Gracilibacillus salinarum]|uniref:Flagellar hook-length control protein-like C-terminal domain-containing protein n=1 Tax=Gracilibacillus salinarum TaxID=2932255 RepID=A0ABY4GMW0_9BACI|nr:hypothetical protein [Gracilibacillus salinarum]UOQ85559.1 hypothetical protein MUN87_01245 [Gracilibacillus salinarum]